jgi:DNA-binding transcriptional LysR family regulator
VAEELNFRKAAQRLNLTQPPLSRQVRLLEESLGVPLFVRTRHAVHLTSTGALLLEKARTLLTQAGQVEEMVRQKGIGNSGTIVIGVSMNLAESIHRVGIQHLRRYPKIPLVYREMASTPQSEALRRCEIDVGFVRPPVNPAYVVSEPLFSQPFVVILSKTHRLSGCKKVKLAQLADETLFLFPRKNSKGLHDKVLAMYRRAGITPRVVHTTLSPHTAGSMYVAYGKGIYILSTKAIMLDKHLVAAQLNEPDATMEVHIAWRKGEQSPHILQFVDTARSVFKAKVVPEGKGASSMKPL